MLGYFKYRADVLNDEVRFNLMNKNEAKELYENLLASADKNRMPVLPLNKQSKEKKNPAYLTCIVNLLIATSLQDDWNRCDYDPRELTLVTNQNRPFRTLSRRFDGALPSTVNPIAIWEIKEYYYTTTFGSRIADGVYETLLDGWELKDLKDSSNQKIEHYLIVDAYSTWWEQGRSYLCRMIDMLNMGMVDEIIFGKEVVQRIPKLFKELHKRLDINK